MMNPTFNNQNESDFMKLPADIHFKTMKKLSLKELAQVQSVCKLWKSIIHNPEFINYYYFNQQNPQLHLFVMEKSETNYKFYLVDDNLFLSKPLTAPKPLSSLTNIILLANIEGYLCFYGDVDSETKRVVMWNPKWDSTDGKCVECVRIDIPISNPEYEPRVGFGVCPHTGDIKLLKTDVDYKSGEPKVELFTIDTRLGTHEKKTVSETSGIWRDLECSKVCEKGVIYFRAYDNIRDFKGRSVFFVSFDLLTEKFGLVCLPKKLAHTQKLIQTIKVNGSLGLLEYHDGVCDVWTWEEGADKTFTKIYTHVVEDKSLYGNVLEFTNKRKAVVEERSGKRGMLFARAC